ncbi:MAG TPA: glycosyltransferase family 4 protein [Longimicrobiales bacterium]
MRVALLTNFIPPYRVSLFRALRKRVGELRIFISTTMESGRAWPVDWQDLDVVVQKSWTIRRSWKQPEFEEPLEVHFPYDTLQQLAHYRPDRIITAELGARSLQALLFGKSKRIPVVLWATLSDRTEEHWGFARRALRKFMIPRFDRVIVNGADGARYIKRFRDDAPLQVPYTTDTAPFLALPLEPRGRELLFVGSLTRRKGFHLLLDACAAHKFKLLVVGDGPLRREQPTIEYAGNVPYDDLPRWFARAGFLIMPSLADEWGVVVNEALAAGVPVIGSNYSQAVAELIEEGRNGWRFDPTDADAVAGAIKRALATDDDTLQRMRAQAREAARALHPDAAAERIAHLLKNL